MGLQSLALIGHGKLGSKLLQAWVEKNPLISYVVVTPQELTDVPKVKWLSPESREFLKVDVAVFCLKPQVLGNALPLYKNRFSEDTLLISTAAGKNLNFYEEFFPHHPWVRAMPNVAVSVGESFTGLLKNQNVSDSQAQFVEDLFSSVGEVEWLESDEKMSILTAITGSGPGYIFYLAECLCTICNELGFSEELSLKMIVSLLKGSSALLTQEPHPQVLRERVTSPQGTTAAALDVLMTDESLKRLFKKAIQQAIKRSEELSRRVDEAT